MSEQPADNFLGLSPAESDHERARFAVLPIPYDGTTTFLSGTRNGPQAILNASRHVELFDEELGAEFHEAGIATFSSVESDARGPEYMNERIFRRARRAVRAGKFLIGLGGEHGVTSALVRATMTRHRKLSVLQIDAHADLRNQYEGSAYSHASVMRRVHDLGAQIVPVGIRNWSLEEDRFMRKVGLKPITARQCFESDDWLDEALNRLGDKVYVTVDVDGFDPSFAPGTGTPEPGGLDWYQVTSLLRAVAEEKTLVGADVVEVLPIAGQAVTEFLAARTAYKIICYSQLNDTAG